MGIPVNVTVAPAVLLAVAPATLSHHGTVAASGVKATLPRVDLTTAVAVIDAADAPAVYDRAALVVVNANDCA